MKLTDKDGVQFYTFESFDKTGIVRHGFSTRLGGVSENEYAEMNLSFSKGDAKEKVVENFKLLASAAGVDYKNMVFSDQVHKTNIYHAKKDDRGKGLLFESDIKEIDALCTDESSVALTTFYADCVPLFFLDTKRRVVALAHAGWRGTVGEIGKLTVAEMVSIYECKTENMLAGIGPCIGVCCFEVDYPVYKEFKMKFKDIEQFTKKNGDKYNIDLVSINRKIIIESGISEENVECADICTKCNSHMFFSHRLMGDARGGMASFIELEC